MLETKRGLGRVRVKNDSLRAAMATSGLWYPIGRNPDELLLLSSAVFDVLITKHLTGTFQPLQTRASFESFIFAIIERMDHRFLEKASATNAADLDEEFLQKEFYRAVCTILSTDQKSFTVQGNAGFASDPENQSTKGKCDFFIDTTFRWSIELLFQGNEIKEHVDRFRSDGRYAILDSKQKAVIDFHVIAPGRDYNPAPTTDKVRAEVLWVVKYDADFTQATVIYPVKEGRQWVRKERVINLQELRS